MSSPPSVPPPGVPQSGNAKYAVVAILLVLGAGGLYAWRAMSQGGPQPPQVVVALPSASTSATAATTNPKIDDIPPAPTAEEKPEAGPAPKVAYTGSGGCDKTCTGALTPDLQGALQVRGNQARRCYMQALANDSSLRGKVAISLRISSAGTACSVAVASNDMATPAVANCAASIFRNATYPSPRGGCVDLSVPLNFVPQGQ